MTIYGYARVSTGDQKLDGQLDQSKARLWEDLREKISGASPGSARAGEGAEDARPERRADRLPPRPAGEVHQGSPQRPGRDLRPRRLVQVAGRRLMGFRSGEYFGKKNSLAPTARMSWRTALPLWLPRLSGMTMSPDFNVGTRTFST